MQREASGGQLRRTVLVASFRHANFDECNSTRQIIILYRVVSCRPNIAHKNIILFYPCTTIRAYLCGTYMQHRQTYQHCGRIIFGRPSTCDR